MIAAYNRFQLYHTGEKPFKCLVCDEKFPSILCLFVGMWKYFFLIYFIYFLGNYKYIGYTFINTGNECSVCAYNRVPSISLKHHIIHHTGEKSMKYSVCDEKCPSNFCLFVWMWIGLFQIYFICLLGNYNYIRYTFMNTGNMCSLCDHNCVPFISFKSHIIHHNGEKLSQKVNLIYYIEFVINQSSVEHIYAKTILL